MDYNYEARSNVWDFINFITKEYGYRPRSGRNSIRPDGQLPDDLLDKSYQLVLEGFSKKRQKEILASESQKQV